METNNSLIKVFDEFFELEKKMDLFQLKIQGIFIWERVRFILFYPLLNQKFGQQFPHAKFRFNSHSISNLFMHFANNFILRNPLTSRKKDIIFWGHSRRKMMENNYWWDIECDPLILKLKNSYEMLEEIETDISDHKRPAMTKNLKYLDFFNLIYFLKRKLKTTEIKLTTDECETLKNVENRFKTDLDFTFDLTSIVINILKTRSIFFPMFVRYLKKTKPKLVVVVVGYTTRAETFVEAAKSLKIPTAELQHGVIHSIHLAYSFPSKARKFSFSDYFLSYGEYWNNCISYPIPNSHVINIGFAHLENQSKKYSKLLKKKQIVFISSAEYGKAIVSTAIELHKKIGSEYKIIIKFHPGEIPRWKKLYPELLGLENLVVDSDNPPLHKLLAESSFQIGVDSTVIFEGIYFGCSTLLLNVTGVELLQYLIDSGFATLVNDTEEIISDLKKSDNKKFEKNYYFFSKNSTNNFLNFITKFTN